MGERVRKVTGPVPHDVVLQAFGGIDDPLVPGQGEQRARMHRAGLTGEAVISAVCTHGSQREGKPIGAVGAGRMIEAIDQHGRQSRIG